MKDIVIIGAGGLGREVAQYIKDINKTNPTYRVLGFIDNDINKKGILHSDIPVLGDFDALDLIYKTSEQLYGFCAVANPKIKKRLVNQMKEYNIKDINIIHPSAYITPEVKIGEGVLISPYCVLTTNITIGNHVHINPQCGIGHDTTIGDYTTLYWSVNISGNVDVECEVAIGSKAFIKQGLKIGKNSIIGAGTVVIKNVKEATTVAGVPAREI
ncbi:MAG: acetyltransferase [Epulopiscium sp.]|nr:acetyltransferase [Candidatus Epulonipiscium sp.]